MTNNGKIILVLGLAFIAAAAIVAIVAREGTIDPATAQVIFRILQVGGPSVLTTLLAGLVINKTNATRAKVDSVNDNVDSIVNGRLHEAVASALNDAVSDPDSPLTVSPAVPTAPTAPTADIPANDD